MASNIESPITALDPLVVPAGGKKPATVITQITETDSGVTTIMDKGKKPFPWWLLAAGGAAYLLS